MPRAVRVASGWRVLLAGDLCGCHHADGPVRLQIDLDRGDLFLDRGKLSLCRFVVILFDLEIGLVLCYVRQLALVAIDGFLQVPDLLSGDCDYRLRLGYKINRRLLKPVTQRGVDLGETLLESGNLVGVGSGCD